MKIHLVKDLSNCMLLIALCLFPSLATTSVNAKNQKTTTAPKHNVRSKMIKRCTSCNKGKQKINKKKTVTKDFSTALPENESIVQTISKPEHFEQKSNICTNECTDQKVTIKQMPNEMVEFKLNMIPADMMDVTMLPEEKDMLRNHTSRTLSIPHNVHIGGNVDIAPGHCLTVDCINGGDTETVCFNNDVAVHPDKLLLANNINPVKQVLSEDLDTIICIPDDTCGVATNFSGDIKVRNAHILGQTESILFGVSTQTQVLCLTFDQWSDNPFDANTGTGGSVKLKLFGTARGHDFEDTVSFFDVFVELDVFVGPGNSFIDVVTSSPTIFYGHDFGHSVSVSVDLIKDYQTPNTVCIALTFTGEISESFTFDWVDAVTFYDVVSSNLIQITCPTNIA